MAEIMGMMMSDELTVIAALRTEEEENSNRRARAGKNSFSTQDCLRRKVLDGNL